VTLTFNGHKSVQIVLDFIFHYLFNLVFYLASRWVWIFNLQFFFVGSLTP
jgi:hypothetical protein